MTSSNQIKQTKACAFIVCVCVCVISMSPGISCLSSFPGGFDPPPSHIRPFAFLSHPPFCASLTSAFLRLLVRGDVFYLKTVASAWGSGREGALGAPVFEENTSAKGFRASKPYPRASTPAPASKPYTSPLTPALLHLSSALPAPRCPSKQRGFFCLSSFPGGFDPPPSHIRPFAFLSLPPFCTSLTSAFLRLLVRGDVFSLKTVASAWGSGREGARGAPVFEENTSAKGFRASKPRTCLKTPDSYFGTTKKVLFFHSTPTTVKHPSIPPCISCQT